MTQEQKDQIEAQTAVSGDEALAATPSPSSPIQETADSTVPQKRGRKKGRLVNAEEVLPRPSYWPLSLATALIITLIGFVTHPVVIGVGALLIVICVIGWALERR